MQLADTPFSRTFNQNNKMKPISYLLALLLVYPATEQMSVYVGSTPANAWVRTFLGISHKDSIDFIRWKVETDTKSYRLICQYGVGKPNTNGFIDEKHVSFSGHLKKDGNNLNLSHDGRMFSMMELNENLLHLLDTGLNLLVGNGGFSYTLNREDPSTSTRFNFAGDAEISDKMVFEGRTPCGDLAGMIGIPGCYKLKWRISFYLNAATGAPQRFEMMGTGFRKEGVITGEWTIKKGADGRTIYTIRPDKRDYELSLLRADENILLFADRNGNPLVGNEDFSYTLNRMGR